MVSRSQQSDLCSYFDSTVERLSLLFLLLKHISNCLAVDAGNGELIIAVSKNKLDLLHIIAASGNVMPKLKRVSLGAGESIPKETFLLTLNLILTIGSIPK